MTSISRTERSRLEKILGCPLHTLPNHPSALNGHPNGGPHRWISSLARSGQLRPFWLSTYQMAKIPTRLPPRKQGALGAFAIPIKFLPCDAFCFCPRIIGTYPTTKPHRLFHSIRASSFHFQIKKQQNGCR